MRNSAMDDAQVAFVRQLTGATQKKDDFEKLENQKRAAIETAMNSLTSQMKDEIREGMTFSIKEKQEDGIGGKLKKPKKISSFSEEGQEHAIDTFGATRRGMGISSEDQPRVQKAMDQ